MASSMEVAKSAFTKVFEYSMALITGTKWMAQNYKLTKEVGSVPDMFNAYPYQIALIDLMCTDNADYERITVLKSARIGWTQLLVGVVMYQISKARRNILFFLDNDSSAKEFTKDNIDPSFEACPITASAIQEMRDKRSHDTMTYKKLNGKSLRIRGGTAGRNYRGKTVDTVILDELDAFPSVVKATVSEEEGTPVELSNVRTRLSHRGPMVIAGSSPVEMHSSQIYREYQRADVSFQFYVPCPHCEVRSPLIWEQMKKTIPVSDEKYDDMLRAGKVAHECPHCKKKAYQSHRPEMLKQGRWEVPKYRDGEPEQYYGCYIKTDPDGKYPPLLIGADGNAVPFPKFITFYIWSAYNPDTSWESIALDYIRAEDDPLTMKKFLNTTLGRPWLETSEEVTEAQLMARMKPVKALPNEYQALYAAVDVQDGGIGKDGWLSVLLTAYAPGERSIILNQFEFFGDTSLPQGSAWQKLIDWLRTWPHYENESGESIGIHGLAIDSGWQTATVYQMYFVLANIIGGNRVLIIKGYETLKGKAVVNIVPSREKGKPPVYSVGTHQAKITIMNRFHKTDYVTLAEGLDEKEEGKVVRELTAERLTEKRTPSGRTVKEWKKIRKRNEALDCAVYTLAMHRVMRPYQGQEITLVDTEDEEEPLPIETVKEDSKEYLTVNPEQSDNSHVKTEPTQHTPRPVQRVFGI